MRGLHRRGCLAACAAGWVLAFVVASASARDMQQASAAAREDMTQYLPPGDGKALVVKYCASCHGLDGIVRLRTTRRAWEAMVFDMVGRGAPLLVEEADAVTEYLADVFGPKAPPLVDINAAGPEELTRLPGVTPRKAGQVIAYRKTRGPFASRDAAREVLGLDQRAFDSVKWYLRVRP